jgi:predicted anti-sigma-YlaC factor YlaD
MGRLASKMVVALALVGAGCSLRSIATKAMANALAGSGGSYASDDDPELVRAAVPFALKTMEQVAEEQPKHVGLATALAAGFTEYGYAFVQQDADMLEDKDVARAKELRVRARRLFLRARDQALRGLEIVHPGIAAPLHASDPAKAEAALAACTKDDVALLYWLGASWSLAISDGKDQMQLVGQLPVVEKVMARAYQLDPSWDRGAIEEFYVAYDGSRSEAEGGGPKRAREHLDRALALSQNTKLGPIVSYAEAVTVTQQDKKEFTRLLEQVLAADVDKHPEVRLANLIAQRRARWLLERTADLFAE